MSEYRIRMGEKLLAVKELLKDDVKFEQYLKILGKTRQTADAMIAEYLESIRR